ncbi:helix-turn-helix domain-containing protein [Actinoallomurus sp. NPDC050550]|uniref:TetR/AcrR family transcriptional regulator n=1 Tax=Actinoallomurus sp. NPDC050550 TaxID=3154937 RepID=UPI0033C0CDB1
MSGSVDSGTGERRADARRNRARVLEAAQEVFAADGLAVPLSEIARRAGVGPGTVYRHFASKEALFEAVVADRLARLVDETAALAADDDPEAAFFAAFSLVVERASLNRALCEALMDRTGRSVEVAAEVRERYRAALAALLERAQRAGAVRADVTVDDVQRLARGCMSMEQEGSSGRATAIVCDGLRSSRPEPPASLPPVTKRVPEVRNESRPETTRARSAAKAAGCAECGAPIETAHTGRPARFCGAACRQKAHRRRTAGRTD